MKTSANEILSQLGEMGDERAKAAMARFAIPSHNAFGISIPALRKTAKAIGTNHELALELWNTRNHEARVIAALIDDPAKVTEQQMEKWVRDFDNWAICDCCCGVLFDKTPYAFYKAMEWSYAEEEFIKRAGFSMMAELAVHDKKAVNKKFIPFFKRIEQEAHDDRNFVKKAVNWALRQIGKRNTDLHAKAIAFAEKIKLQQSKSAKWIAGDALRELQNEKIVERIKK